MAHHTVMADAQATVKERFVIVIPDEIDITAWDDDDWLDALDDYPTVVHAVARVHSQHHRKIDDHNPTFLT